MRSAGFIFRAINFSLVLVFLSLTLHFAVIPAFAAPVLSDINKRVCDRFENDTSILAAVMDEVRSRKGIKETRVAFGGVDTQIESADYSITYSAEAIAYQRSKKYTSVGALKSDLQILAGKIIKAKAEVGKAINE
jgi:hypothetical protein